MIRYALYVAVSAAEQGLGWKRCSSKQGTLWGFPRGAGEGQWQPGLRWGQWGWQKQVGLGK